MLKRLPILLVLGLNKEDNLQILNVCPFDYTAVAGSECWTHRLVNHNRRVFVDTPMWIVLSRSTIAHVIGHFGGVFVLSLCFFQFSVA